MTGLGVLQGIYLAILGLGDFGRQVALRSCLWVMKTKAYALNLWVPEAIRGHHAGVLRDKQRSLTCAFRGLTA